MLYPFNVLDLGEIPGILEEQHPSLDSFKVDLGWSLIKTDSFIIKNFVSTLGLEIHENIFISRSRQCVWHIDRFEFYRILHRVLVPKTENFVWQFEHKGKVETISPKKGHAYLFNNMKTHRFYSTDNRLRDTLYFDLVDPSLKKHLPAMTGNNMEFNRTLDNEEIRKQIVLE